MSSIKYPVSPVSSTIMFIHPKAFIRSTGCFTTCSRLVSNILWIVWEHSPECFATFRGHSPECLRTFPDIFGNIPRNVWRHSPEYLGHSSECFTTFPGMFGNIPRNIKFPIPHVPRISFRVPIFLVLYITVTLLDVSLHDKMLYEWLK